MTNNPTIDGVSRELTEPSHQMAQAGCQAYIAADGMIGIMHHSSMGHAYVAMRALDPEVAALQSTIAQLQARITELESGRGELAGYGTLKSSGFGSWLFPTEQSAKSHLKTAMGGKPLEAEVVPLYIAPPAPVAVLWEIRIPDEPKNPDSPAEYFYAQNAANRDLLLSREGATVVAEYACLDATAALNEVKL